MSDRDSIRSLLKEFVQEVRKDVEERKHRPERGHDHKWMQGNEDSLMLNDPGTMVDKDARSKISHFLKAMGLMA